MSGSDDITLSVGDVISLSVSVGLAHSPTHAQDAQRLYLAAEEPLDVL